MADTDPSTSTRPRRSTRTATKLAVAPESPGQGKRKARETAKTPAERLEYLLKNPKSKLANIDIANVINYNNFLELSEESQLRLCALLPPTAFYTYTPSICPAHPDSSSQQPSPDAMDIDRTPATLDPTIFTSPFFLSAAHTWQDHLFSSWLGQKASEDLEKFNEAARNGSLHAQWKDEVWERDRKPKTHPIGKRGQQTMLDLTMLAKQGLIRQGDILVYKRHFAKSNATVEKDLLIDTINPNSHSITFLLSPGSQTALQPSLLVSGSHEFDGKVLSMEDISDPVALERGVLDVDGRVNSLQKYEEDVAACPSPYTASGAPSDELKNLIAVRAWKAFTVWRWRDEMRDQVDMQLLLNRGGRELSVSLFYLRACCAAN